MDSFESRLVMKRICSFLLGDAENLEHLVLALLRQREAGKACPEFSMLVGMVKDDLFGTTPIQDLIRGLDAHPLDAIALGGKLECAKGEKEVKS